MKKYLLWAVCMCCTPVFALSLNPESKREARLFNQFLKAVYAQRAEDPRAFSYLEQALRMDPESKYLKRMLVSQALADGNPALADAYANFISQGENDPEDYMVYAAYQWKKGQLSQAAQTYEQALQQAPDDVRILYQYVLLLSVMDWEKATQKLLSLAEEYPALASDIYTEIGTLCLRNKDLQQALQYYNKALELDPSNPQARLGRGEVYEKSSQYFLMLHEFEELEKMGYANAGTLSRMGSVFLMVKDVPKAEDYFLKAKADDNADVPSAYFLSLIAEQRGDYSRAVGYLRDAADYDRSASKWLQVSFYQQRLNQPEESLKTLAQAYKKFEGNVEVAYFYALALNDRKSYKKAARVLEKLLQSNPSYDEARLQYAFTLESLKRYKEMEFQLGLLLEKNPRNGAALNLYAYSLAQRGERLQKAQEYAARALAVNPDDASFIDTQAWVFFKQGKLQEAADLLASIPAETVQANAEIAYHLGAVLCAQGRWSEARPYLEQARTELKEADKLYRKLPADF